MFSTFGFCHHVCVEEKTNYRGKLFDSIRRVAIALILVYLGVCALVFFYQRKLLYHPKVYLREQVSQLAVAANLERWTNSAGQFIGMKRLVTNQPVVGRVLMFYGNGSSAVDSSDYADVIQAIAPLDFYVLEYPGYEDRPGTPSKDSLLSAAREALQSVATNAPIYLVGQSLGTGVATYLAGEFPEKIAGIILQSPYDRLANVAQAHYPWLPARWIMLDDFRSADYLRPFHGKVGIMIGDQDEVVPAKLGRQLFETYAGPKKLWEYPAAHHVELGESPEKFWSAVIKFWQNAE